MDKDNVTVVSAPEQDRIEKLELSEVPAYVSPVIEGANAGQVAEFEIYAAD